MVRRRSAPEDVRTGKGQAAFVALRYSHDMFSGCQYQASATAGIGYNTQHNSKPPAGLKKLDSLETINVVYSF
jgi:hypothetical protein